MSDALTAVKLGGNVLTRREDLNRIWAAARTLADQDQRVLLIHGAGPQISALTRLQGAEPRQIQGRRITDDAARRALLWSARGEVNAELVAAAHAAGVRAAGVSGVDGGTIVVRRRPPWTIDGTEVDFQWVGDVETVDLTLLQALLDAAIVPVVASLGVDSQGEIFNVNADTVAVALAGALGASRLLLITESGGVKASPVAGAALIPSLDRDQIETGIADGWISDGMAVKLTCAVAALEAGVRKVEIGGADAIAGRGGTSITL